MKHDPSIKPEQLGNGGSDQPGPPDAALQERLRSVCRPFTCRELADLTHVSSESVRRYLGGQNPGVVFLKRLCEVLNISADWLLLGRGVPMFRADAGSLSAEGSIDQALETLGAYFKQLNIELKRFDPSSVGVPTNPREPSEAPPPVAGPQLESSSESFVPPGAIVPTVGPVRVRLLLGPANGKQLEFPESPPEEILIQIDETGEARQAHAADPGALGIVVYRRIMDRVYRWVTPNR